MSEDTAVPPWSRVGTRILENAALPELTRAAIRQLIRLK